MERIQLTNHRYDANGNSTHAKNKQDCSNQFIVSVVNS